MGIIVSKTASARDVLTRVNDLRWSRTPHTSAVAFAGQAPFHLGQKTFNRVADLADRVAIAHLELTKRGIQIHQDDYRIIVSPHVASFNFSSGAAFLHMMGELKGEAMINGTAGSNLVVQVHKQDEFWHHAALLKNISFSNRLLYNEGEEPVQIVEHPEADRVDYIFPTTGSMSAFCDFIQSGNLDAAAKVARDSAAEPKAALSSPQPQTPN